MLDIICMITCGFMESSRRAMLRAYLAPYYRNVTLGCVQQSQLEI